MNIEEFVNKYLKEYRHEVLLNPYNGLVEFAKAFQEKLTEDAVEGVIEEAEKDLALTWEDIALIDDFLCEVPSMSKKKYYIEVFERFKEAKK